MMNYIFQLIIKLQSFFSRNVLNLLYITFFVAMIRLYLLSQRTLKEWTISDWLINYQDGGFKRRGLGGSLIFGIQDVTGFELNSIIFFIQFIFYGFIFYKLREILLTRKVDDYFISFIYLPVSIFFLWISVKFLGRKEIVLFAIALYFVNGNLTVFKKYVTILFFALTLFLHEGLYFYLPFLIAYQIVIEKRLDAKFAGIFIAISTLIMISFVFFGNSLNGGNSIEIIKNRGTLLHPGNAIDYDETSKLQHLKAFFLSYSVHLLEFIFVIVYFSIYIRKNFSEKFTLCIKFIVLSILFVAPLFILAIDWVRWIHIYSILLLILVSLFLEKHNEKKIVFNKLKNSPFIFVIVALLFVEFLFHLQHDNIIILLNKMRFK